MPPEGRVCTPSSTIYLSKARASTVLPVVYAACSFDNRNGKLLFRYLTAYMLFASCGDTVMEAFWPSGEMDMGHRTLPSNVTRTLGLSP